MYQKGDLIRVDPMENYLAVILNEGLSLDRTYVVEDVIPAEVDPYGWPHDESVCLQEEPDKEFGARWFMPA